MTRTVRFGAMGAVLAVGAPLGWLALRVALGRLEGGSVSSELGRNLALYAYMLLGCLMAFTLFGARIGWLAERLAEADAVHARESITDPLTGLYNPRLFHRRFAEEISRADRGGRSLGLVLIDLDHFKQLNDRFGHAAGDQALVEVGKRIAEGCRTGDVACRIGGEEFAILCPDTTVETALALADRLRQSLAAIVLEVDGGVVSLTASFGVGAWARGETPDALFARIDAALYGAKTKGRNRVEAVLAGPSTVQLA